MIGQRYRKWVVTLQVGVWVPIYAPIDCNDFWIKSRDNSTVRECTEVAPTDLSSYDIIQPGVMQSLGQWILVSSGTGLMFGNTRFKKDDFVTSLAGDTGTTVCVVTFVL